MESPLTALIVDLWLPEWAVARVDVSAMLSRAAGVPLVAKTCGWCQGSLENRSAVRWSGGSGGEGVTEPFQLVDRARRRQAGVGWHRAQ